MEDLQPYQSYLSAEAAQPLLDILQHKGIPYETAVERGQSAVFDPSFAYNASFSRVVVKLSPADFEWVRRLESEAHQQLMAEVDPDHYLFKFSDAELFDVLSKPDEWNSFDVSLAGQLLRERGRDISADALQGLRQQRNAELAKPEKDQTGWVVAGYILALLGGFLAIFIGWHLYRHRKTLPDGRQVAAFSASDQRHGFRILVLGIICSIGWVIVRILTPASPPYYEEIRG